MIAMKNLTVTTKWGIANKAYTVLSGKKIPSWELVNEQVAENISKEITFELDPATCHDCSDRVIVPSYIDWNEIASAPTGTSKTVMVKWAASTPLFFKQQSEANRFVKILTASIQELCQSIVVESDLPLQETLMVMVEAAINKAYRMVKRQPNALLAITYLEDIPVAFVQLITKEKKEHQTVWLTNNVASV